MLETFRTLLTNQYEAVFCMLNTCIDRCPDSGWDAPVGTKPFSQVAFHTLFFTDYYLGTSPDGFRDQPFHLENTEHFRDYEEFEWREPVLLYERPFVTRYVQHCRTKARDAIAAEAAESLNGPSRFPRRDFTRAELYVYNMRHVHHHAAQFSLRLRIDHEVDIPWFGSGWTDE